MKASLALVTGCRHCLSHRCREWEVVEDGEIGHTEFGAWETSSWVCLGGRQIHDQSAV